MILAGDIGGTKTNLGLFESKAGALVPVIEEQYPSASYSGVEEMAQRFLKDHPAEVASASFGVACPIVDGVCHTTNLPWSISVAELRKTLHIPLIGLINDLEAMALGISTLPTESLATLNEGGGDPLGARAVVAAGTGLGEATLIPNAPHYRVIASEGGHADFAPTTDLQIELLRYLTKKFGRVSYERILSGPGLHNVYGFMRQTDGTPEPSWLSERMTAIDPSAAITEAALANKDSVCVRSLDLFVSIYGAEAGNMALKVFASGGVYLGGGIAPKILPKLKDGTFMKAFQDKGRLAPFLSSLPVHVILDPRGALGGAAVHAMSLLSTFGGGHP